MQMLRPVRGLAAALATVVLLTLASAHVCAWSNGGYSADLEDPDYGTHDWIAEQALTLQTMDVSFLSGTYRTDYLVGTEAPDNPVFIGDTSNHHVYYFSSGDLQDDASAVRAEAMYDLALERLEAGDFSVTAYYAGAMTHYIADMGVFGHTMGAYTDWGTEVHHSDYEDEFEDRLDSFVLPAGLELGNLTAYDAALELARDTTFGSGDVQPNIWMDSNYDWGDDTFETSAMASLHMAVVAVAAALNHLMAEAAYEPPLEPTEPEEPEEQDDPTAPGEPEGFEAYLDGANVVLVWAPPLDDGGAAIIEYIVYRGDTASSRAKVATVPSGTLTWTDGSAEAGVTYYYSVAARNAVGIGPLSEMAAVKVSSEESSSMFLVAAISAIVAALGTGGAVAWRRSRRRTPK